MSETVRIGVPTSRPNWVSERPRSFLIWMPMIAKIVQTAKHTVKANVENQSALPWSDWLTPIGADDPVATAMTAPVPCGCPSSGCGSDGVVNPYLA